jgi:hypothetical protein
MFTFEDEGTPLCDGITRREILRVGGLGAFGLSMGSLLQGQQARAVNSDASRAHSFGKAKSCIVLFLLGGPPQHETWDPKPEAPAEIRGDLRPMQTSVPGMLVGELMPRTARLAHHIAALRAVSTNDSAHSASGYAMSTGMAHAPRGVENAKPGAPNDWPSFGAVVKRLRTGRSGSLPAAITVPERMANDGNLTWPGQDAGWLGRTADPWVLNCDPSAQNFSIPELGLPGDVPAVRLDRRRSLLTQVNQRIDNLERANAISRFDIQSRQVYDLLRSSQARQAFDLNREPTSVRDRYGRTKFGQSTLLARRLVEAGVSLVQVSWSRLPGALNNGHWDTHGQNTNALKQLMPVMDRTYSALLEDLAERGLLDETLVIWMGEFGRTPRLNGGGGRDHWGPVFSVALAGGGIKGGQVYGSSDRIAAYPRDGRVQPQDLTATIFHCLGHSPDTEIHDALGRPHPISRGDVVRGIF